MLGGFFNNNNKKEKQKNKSVNNNNNQNLDKFPPGKTYLSAPHIRLKQSKQKGPTCMLDAMKMFVPRYGKAFPETHPKRRLELIVSEFKDLLTEVRNDQNEMSILIKALRKRYPSQRQTKRLLKVFLKKFYDNDGPLQYLVSEYNEILKYFFEQIDFTTFEKYWEYQYHGRVIEASRQTIELLGYCPNRECAKLCYLADGEMNAALLLDKLNDKDLTEKWLDQKFSSIEDKALSFLATANLKIFDQYLTVTDWKHGDSFEKFEQTITAKGAMEVLGYFGRQCFNGTVPLLAKNFSANRHLFMWDESKYKEGPNLLHAVIVIDAKRENGYENVYFIDPNDDSPDVSGKGKMYVISYQLFKKSLRDIFGNSIEDSVLPYGFHSDQKQHKYLYDFYSRYDAKEFYTRYNMDQFFKAYEKFAREDTIDESPRSKFENRMARNKA